MKVQQKPGGITSFDEIAKLAAPSKPRPVQLNLTVAELARCERSLLAKLSRAIVNSPEDGDVGVISKLVADLRALDLIEGTKAPPIPVPAPIIPPEVARRQAAASDDAKMQAYSAEIARKEAIDSARSEG